MSKVCETLSSYRGCKTDYETFPPQSRAALPLGILVALLAEGQGYSLGSEGLWSAVLTWGCSVINKMVLTH